MANLWLVHVFPFPPNRVSSFNACFAIRTEARHVETTDVLLFYVACGAIRSQRTETSLVVVARRLLEVRIYVQEEALVAIGAKPVARELYAFGHLAKVVLVQELTGIAFLAQTSQPVLAN